MHYFRLLATRHCRASHQASHHPSSSTPYPSNHMPKVWACKPTSPNDWLNMMWYAHRSKAVSNIVAWWASNAIVCYPIHHRTPVHRSEYVCMYACMYAYNHKHTRTYSWCILTVCLMLRAYERYYYGLKFTDTKVPVCWFRFDLIGQFLNWCLNTFPVIQSHMTPHRAMMIGLMWTSP